MMVSRKLYRSLVFIGNCNGTGLNRKTSATIRCKAMCFSLACEDLMLSYVDRLLQTFGDTSLVTLKCFDTGTS